jgi:hypothetical protein
VKVKFDSEGGFEEAIDHLSFNFVPHKAKHEFKKAWFFNLKTRTIEVIPDSDNGSASDQKGLARLPLNDLQPQHHPYWFFFEGYRIISSDGRSTRREVTNENQNDFTAATLTHFQQSPVKSRPNLSFSLGALMSMDKYRFDEGFQDVTLKACLSIAVLSDCMELCCFHVRYLHQMKIFRST